MLRNPLAETLAAGQLGIAMIVQKVHAVDIALAARSCGFDALSVDLELYRSWPVEDSLRVLNAATTVVVMLETPEAVERADEIAAVPGVDIVHIGSVDLCDALGMPLL